MQEGDMASVVIGGNGNNAESKRGHSETHLGESRCGNKLTVNTLWQGKKDTEEFQQRVTCRWQSLPSWFRVLSWRSSMLKRPTDNWTNRARLVLALQPLSHTGAFPAWCIDLSVNEVGDPGWWKALRHKVPLDGFWIHLSFHTDSKIITVPPNLFSGPWLWIWHPMTENSTWKTAAACPPQLIQAGVDFIPFLPSYSGG